MGEMMEQKLISEDSKVVFVDDGTNDNTWGLIKKLHNENVLFSGLNLHITAVNKMLI
jgi:hypothetical protein